MKREMQNHVVCGRINAVLWLEVLRCGMGKSVIYRHRRSNFSRSCASVATPACNEKPAAFANVSCQQRSFGGLTGGDVLDYCLLRGRAQYAVY